MGVVVNLKEFATKPAGLKQLPDTTQRRRIFSMKSVLTMAFKQCILLGPPGVDLPKQARELAHRWQVPHIVASSLIREAMASQSEVGLAIAPYVEAGELVPDKEMLTLIRRRCEQPDAMLNGWVLTGFPRTVAQAQGFEAWLAAVGLPPARVVYLKAMAGLLINRLWIASGHTATTASIQQRLAQHTAETEPLLEVYRQRSQLTTLNASLSFDEVAHELFQLGQPTHETTPLIQNEAELDALLARERLLVVDGMASWCGPCKMVTPIIDQLATAYCDRVKVMKMDFDANQQVPKRFGVKGMPVVMVFKDGELQETLTGVKPYQDYSTVVSRFLE
jgi:thioredoxin